MTTQHPSTFARRAFLAGAGAALALPSWAQQPAWPAKPIQLVHGFGAGGNADVVARLVAQQLAPMLGQPMVVEIKTGAGGMVATAAVAKAPADGHTLVMLTGAHTVSAAMRKTLPYDPVKDFAFISTVTSFPFFVCVRAEHPAKSLKELVDMAKANANKVSFTSVGVGSTQHLVVIGGEVDLLVDTPTVALPHIQSGRLRALGVTSSAPWPAAASVPTVASTLPGFEVRSWLGLAAPAGTPDAVVRRLNADVRKMLDSPEMQKSLASAGSAPTYSTPEAMRDMVQSDIARWRGVITSRGIQMES
jgi:tripartite-type tricarboxylate transporter receptor subunit TctC